MEADNIHWRTRHKDVYARDLKDLCKQLDEFAKDKFVVATQTFMDLNNLGFKWFAIVYYKISPLEQANEKLREKKEAELDDEFHGKDPDLAKINK